MQASKTLVPLFLAGAMFAAPLIALAAAQDLTFSPVLIDQKGKQRDIINQMIHLKNTSSHKLELYPAVNNVNPKEGQQDFQAAFKADDRSASLANWIEISRGVIELTPGEERDIPLTIRIPQDAPTDIYHANISFTQGSTRADSAPVATVAVNVEVEADLKELMQLNKFTTDSVFFSGDDVLFNYQVQNIGNQELQPDGEIRIYDNRGKEVAALEVNREGKSVSPDQIAQLASAWSAAQGFGKFKAFLTVNYGKSQKASVTDTVYFWIIPWKQLLALFAVCLGGVVGFAVYFHRRLEHSHNARLAIAATSAGIPLPHLHMPHIPMPQIQVAHDPVESQSAKPAMWKRIIWMPITLIIMPFYLLKNLLPFFGRSAEKDITMRQVAPAPAAPVVNQAPAFMPVQRDPQQAMMQMPQPTPQQSVQRPSAPQGGVIDLSGHPGHPHQHSQHQVSQEVHVINLKDLK